MLLDALCYNIAPPDPASTHVSRSFGEMHHCYFIKKHTLDAEVESGHRKFKFGILRGKTTSRFRASFGPLFIYLSGDIYFISHG